MALAIRHPCSSSRVSFAGLGVGDLRPGEWRYPTRAEIDRPSPSHAAGNSRLNVESRIVQPAVGREQAVAVRKLAQVVDRTTARVGERPPASVSDVGRTHPSDDRPLGLT